jgi:hypothetical protein
MTDSSSQEKVRGIFEITCKIHLHRNTEFD